MIQHRAGSPCGGAYLLRVHAQIAFLRCRIVWNAWRIGRIRRRLARVDFSSDPQT